MGTVIKRWKHMSQAKTNIKRLQRFNYWKERAFYDITEIIDSYGRLKLTEAELKEKVFIDSKRTVNGEIVIKFANREKALNVLQRYIK